MRTATILLLSMALGLIAACTPTTIDGSAATSSSTAGGASTQGTTTTPPADPAQTTPDASPSGTTTTPSTGVTGATAQDPAGGAAVVTVAPAMQADIPVGAAVNDPTGQQVGTVESVDAQGAVISTGTARAKIPLSGIGKTAGGGLVTTATRAQIEAAAGGQPSS